jgi:two-component sensor histidine kinase
MAAIETLSTAYPEVDLVSEANHRIANHLALVASMVQMQAWSLARGPEMLTRGSVHSMLQETAGKIIGVSQLHRTLAHSPGERAVDLNSYLVENCRALIAQLGLSERVGIAYQLGQKCAVIADQAQTIGLIVNEIVMNAVRHAHPTDLPVHIQIDCGRDSDRRGFIEIRDDGVGLPENFDEARDGGLGFRLIRSLTRKLDAQLQIESTSLGLSFRLSLPVE